MSGKGTPDIEEGKEIKNVPEILALLAALLAKAVAVILLKGHQSVDIPDA